MLTAEQRQLRSKGIGSSDAAAILGLDPFRNAYAVWAEKTGRDPGFAGNEATERGNLLEPVLVAWAESELGLPMKHNVFCQCDDGRPLLANLDACAGTPDSNGFLIEAKTATNLEEWGDEGTDQVPERVTVQTHHAMAVSGYQLAYVPVLLPVFGRFEFRMYEVRRNEDLAKVIADRGVEFWEKHILGDTPPADCEPSLEVLKRLRRVPNKSVEIPDILADAFLVTKATLKLAEEDHDRAKAALIAAMDDAEEGTTEKARFTYYAQTCDRIDTDKLRRRYPDVAERCSKESSYRVLRLGKPRFQSTAFMRNL